MLIVTPTRRWYIPPWRSGRPELLPTVGLYVASLWGRIPDVRGAWGVGVGVRCCEVGVVERRSEEQSSRLEALPRSLPSGSQSCLICVDRTHFGQDRPGRLGRLVGLSGGICSVVTHGGEHDVGESPFQAAQGFPFRLAGSAFAFVVDAAFGVATNLGDGDCVEGPVELPIPARVEPVSDGATGGGGQRCGAVGCGERVPVG